MSLRETLRNTSRHQAFGWATATCGRLAAYRGFVELAEELLSEAYGRFFLADDAYGTAMVTAHLAIPMMSRGQLDRALTLALEPVACDVNFSPYDRSLIHNIAALCYCERREFHAALFQLNKEYDLVKQLGDVDRRATVLGNLAVILLKFGEWKLALSASTEAWKLQVDHRKREEFQLTHLSNMVHANCQLDRLNDGLAHAEQLIGYLGDSNPAMWIGFYTAGEAFARTKNIEQAAKCLVKAKRLSRSCMSPVIEVCLQTLEALILESKGKFHEASRLACRLIEEGETTMPTEVRASQAALLYRCFRETGRDSEAEKWKRYRHQMSRDVLLGDLLTSQIRANLDRPSPPLLTQREILCLSLSARGQTSADIGLKLGITARTVNFHFSKILRKLNAMNRQEAIAKAVSANLIDG